VSGTDVLIVEDDDGIGSSLVRTLQGEGYTVDWAHSGDEARRLVRPATAVVVLDLGLPDIDGLELCRELRASAAAPQVLILTARREEVDVVLGLDAGADDYLVKPFRLAELLARVRACSRRARTNRGSRLLAKAVLNPRPATSIGGRQTPGLQAATAPPDRCDFHRVWGAERRDL